MTITNTFGRMPLDLVWVERTTRQRRDPDPARGGLLQSIALRGVLMPVILEEVPNADGYHILYAGERRYAASLQLGLEDIPYRFARAPSAREVQIIEFEENAKRLDLTWQETCAAVVAVHAVHVEDDPSHTYEQTGHALGWHDGSLVAKYHFIHASWGDPAVQGCNTVNEAYNLLQRRQRRAQQSKLDDLLGHTGGEDTTDEYLADANEEDLPHAIRLAAAPADAAEASADDASSSPRVAGAGGGERSSVGGPAGGFVSAPRSVVVSRPVAAPIVQGDFREWAPAYTGPKFNLIHCDFPYGIGLGESSHKSGPNSLTREDDELYADTADTYAGLLEAFVTHFDRFASESCHVMFWYSNRTEIDRATRAAFARVPGLTLLRYPLVWHKSDNAGFLTPGHPRHVYETCLVGTRGDRPIVKHVSDCYSAPTDNTLHMSAKPEPMLRYFMSMFCDEHSRVFDPTCGGGSALRAAEALRAERVFGLELSDAMARTALAELLKARALRRAAEGGVK